MHRSEHDTALSQVGPKARAGQYAKQWVPREGWLLRTQIHFPAGTAATPHMGINSELVLQGTQRAGGIAQPAPVQVRRAANAYIHIRPHLLGLKIDFPHWCRLTPALAHNQPHRRLLLCARCCHAVGAGPGVVQDPGHSRRVRLRQRPGATFCGSGSARALRGAAAAAWTLELHPGLPSWQQMQPAGHCEGPCAGCTGWNTIPHNRTR